MDGGLAPEHSGLRGDPGHRGLSLTLALELKLLADVGLVGLQKDSDQEFRIINTHLDHVGEAARLQQAQMIMEDTFAYPSDYPQILCGDMNAEPESSVINLFAAGGWRDTYSAFHDRNEASFTYHGFQGHRFLE